jgi:hypothetical protein
MVREASSSSSSGGEARRSAFMRPHIGRRMCYEVRRQAAV